jgi:protein-S-isoprenylcysteine O-methyltransferase Ste14
MQLGDIVGILSLLVSVVALYYTIVEHRSGRQKAPGTTAGRARPARAIDVRFIAIMLVLGLINCFLAIMLLRSGGFSSVVGGFCLLVGVGSFVSSWFGRYK